MPDSCWISTLSNEMSERQAGKRESPNATASGVPNSTTAAADDAAAAQCAPPTALARSVPLCV